MMSICDPETGSCALPAIHTEPTLAIPVPNLNVTVHYIGDPMCSWCWGISPAIKQLQVYCNENQIKFSITVGGLRPGGGDSWTPEFKAFLRQEWGHISEVTGQPIGFKLLELEQFNYDTEPACRAIVSAQFLQTKNQLPETIVWDFYTAIQYKFYVEGVDSTKVDFYASICAEMGLDFTEFKAIFDSVEGKLLVRSAFKRSREWGVRSFPTLLIERDNKIETLATGFTTAPDLIAKLQNMLTV